MLMVLRQTNLINLFSDCFRRAAQLFMVYDHAENEYDV